MKRSSCKMCSLSKRWISCKIFVKRDKRHTNGQWYDTSGRSAVSQKFSVRLLHIEIWIYTLYLRRSVNAVQVEAVQVSNGLCNNRSKSKQPGNHFFLCRFMHQSIESPGGRDGWAMSGLSCSVHQSAAPQGGTSRISGVTIIPPKSYLQKSCLLVYD